VELADHVRGIVRSTAVWRPADFTDESEWMTILSPAERDEIVAATQVAAEAGLTAATVRQEDFPLPSLATRLAGWVRELSAGRAFVLIRGFPVDVLSDAETELAYVGLGLHLGTPVSQNAAGDLLGHIRDTGVVRDSPAVRLYATNQRQDFHCDGSDLVGLLCLKTAASGGESKIVSSMAVYNEILARRPDLVDVLRQPFAWDRNDEQSLGEDPFFSLPVIFDFNGAPRIFFVGWYIRDAQRHQQAPRLSQSQLDALELLEGINNDPSFYLQMEFQPGDIQLLNNAKILHAREAYIDYDDPAERRHLLRLWLTAHDFASVEDMLRGGIPVRQDLADGD
jgi:Taurine catabolism dioxygenase TauD, TfdA family